MKELTLNSGIWFKEMLLDYIYRCLNCAKITMGCILASRLKQYYSLHNENSREITQSHTDYPNPPWYPAASLLVNFDFLFFLILLILRQFLASSVS